MAYALLQKYIDSKKIQIAYELLEYAIIKIFEYSIKMDLHFYHEHFISFLEELKERESQREMVSLLYKNRQFIQWPGTEEAKKQDMKMRIANVIRK